MSDFHRPGEPTPTPDHKHRCKRCRRILNSTVAGFCGICFSVNVALGHHEPVHAPEPVHVPEPPAYSSEQHFQSFGSIRSESIPPSPVDFGMPPFDGSSVAAQQAVANHQLKRRWAAFFAATSGGSFGPPDAALLS